MKDKEFFSTSEAAKILRISRVAVFKKIKSDEIEAIKVGRNFVIPKDEITKALGLSITDQTKRNIDRTVARAVKEYGEVFRKLGKE